jgi:hypothetical protein
MSCLYSVGRVRPLHRLGPDLDGHRPVGLAVRGNRFSCGRGWGWEWSFVL